MELIVILLGSLLVAPFVAAFTIVVEVGGILLGLIFELLSKRRVRAVHRRNPNEAPPIPSRWPRILLLSGGALVVLTLLAVTIVDLFWFAGFVRWSFDRIETTTAVRVEYSSVEGSAWSGTLAMKDVRVRRTEGDGLRCDVRIERVDLDVAVTSLLFASVAVDSLAIRKVTGEIQWPKSAKKRPRARRSFVVRSLRIEDVDLTLTSGANKPYRLVVPTWRSEPLRAGWLPFDVLFRSNFEGTIAGAQFSVLSEGGPEGRHTRWKAVDLPVSYLAEKLGGKFKLFKAGAVDLEIDDRWSLETVAQIDSHWKIVLRAMNTKNALLRPIVNKIGSKRLEFRLRLDGRGLGVDHETNDGSFWSDVGSAVVAKILGFAKSK